MCNSKRFNALESMKIFEIDGKFDICRPWDNPGSHSNCWIAKDVFRSTYKRASGSLDNVDYQYPEELFFSIQYTSEYKEWESLLPIIQ